MSAPWLWENYEEKVDDPDWAGAKVCDDCHLQYMTDDATHREECM